MKIIIMCLLVIVLFTNNTYSSIWNVGPDRNYKYCSQVNSLLSDGDTVEIDNGFYENDKQVTWTNNNLLIRGIGGTPILKAGDIIATDNSNGKGIFVIKGNNTTIEDIEFTNAKVIDNNGAGIRQEGSNLIVSKCTFSGNEMGILAGGTIQNCTILIEFCKFFNCGSTNNPGYQHNIYINHIDTLIFRFNYSYDATAQGHEFKSRASNNYILYNIISNYTSEDSRNIDIPNGGTAVLIGNIIEQNQNSANSNIIGFGLEGLTNPPPHNLWLTNNTIINKKSTGSFINTANIDTLYLKNNVFAGKKTAGLLIANPNYLDSAYNFINDNISAAEFVNPDNFDYNLKSNSPLIEAGTFITKYVNDYTLNPKYIYKSECDSSTREIVGFIDIGAYEYLPINSINDNYYNQNLKIYPNPAKDFIELNIFNANSNYSKNKVCEIDNSLGQCLITTLIYNNLTQRVDISNLNSGVYYILFEGFKYKFVKI